MFKFFEAGITRSSPTQILFHKNRICDKCLGVHMDRLFKRATRNICPSFQIVRVPRSTNGVPRPMSEPAAVETTGDEFPLVYGPSFLASSYLDPARAVRRRR